MKFFTHIPYNRWSKYRKRKVPCTFSVWFTELWSTQISVIVHPSAGDKLAVVHWSCLFGAESYSAERERKSVWQGFQSQIWQTLQVFIYTAISRKVVGKSARNNPERHCGWVWVLFFFKEIWKNWYERPCKCVCEC